MDLACVGSSESRAAEIERESTVKPQS